MIRTRFLRSNLVIFSALLAPVHALAADPPAAAETAPAPGDSAQAAADPSKLEARQRYENALKRVADGTP